MRSAVVLVLLFQTLSSLASVTIENGRLATEEEMLKRGIVSILRLNNGVEQRHCTGTRITPDIVLTAAHCVRSATVFPYGIRQALDPLDRRVPLEKIKAIKFPFRDFYYRRKFLPGKQHDIALIVLEKSSTRPFVQLGKASNQASSMQYGYGVSTSDFEPTETPNLSVLSNGIVSGVGFKIEVENVNSSTRAGDSGGPFFQLIDGSFKLIGVLSTGNPRLLSEIKTGTSDYQPVYNYLNWIRESIEIPGFNSHLITGPEQFQPEKNIYLTAQNFRQAHKELCSLVTQKIGGNWDFDSKGNCMPRDQKICEKMRDGLIEDVSHSVVWNQKNGICEYLQ